jgi:acetyl-CoA carboxylase carboxyltransferase component
VVAAQRQRRSIEDLIKNTPADRLVAAIDNPAERKKRFDEMVATMYQRGKALNNASHFGIDDVIDPADSRRWIVKGIHAAPPPAPRTGKKHSYIDSW